MQEYIIRIEEHLDPYWKEWFDGIQLSSTEKGETLLTGAIPDQVALYGLLTKIHNLGLTLLAVEQIEHSATMTNNRQNILP